MAFLCGTAPDFGICASTQTLGQFRPDLQLGRCRGGLERLQIGIRGNEFNACTAFLDHVVYGVAACTAHADNLNRRCAVICTAGKVNTVIFFPRHIGQR